MFLYHYYDAKIGPFKNISDLSVDDAKQLLDEIKKESPDCQCAKRQESYVEDRIYYEDILRNLIFLLYRSLMVIPILRLVPE